MAESTPSSSLIDQFHHAYDNKFRHDSRIGNYTRVDPRVPSQLGMQIHTPSLISQLDDYVGFGFGYKS